MKINLFYWWALNPKQGRTEIRKVYIFNITRFVPNVTSEISAGAEIYIGKLLPEALPPPLKAVKFNTIWTFSYRHDMKLLIQY